MKKYRRKTKDVKCRKCDYETRVPIEDRLKDISCRCGGRFRLRNNSIERPYVDPADPFNLGIVRSEDDGWRSGGRIKDEEYTVWSEHKRTNTHYADGCIWPSP